MQRERLVIHCIDKVLDKLGPKVRRSLTFYMWRKFGVKRYEILQKPEPFIEALRHIFGESAVKIEAEILREIELEGKIRPKGGKDLLTLLNELKAEQEGQAPDPEVGKDKLRHATRKYGWPFYETEPVTL